MFRRNRLPVGASAQHWGRWGAPCPGDVNLTLRGAEGIEDDLRV